MFSKNDLLYGLVAGVVGVGVYFSLAGSNEALQQEQYKQQRVDKAKFEQKFDQAWSAHYGQAPDASLAEEVKQAKAELEQAKAAAAVAEVQSRQDENFARASAGMPLRGQSGLPGEEPGVLPDPKADAAAKKAALKAQLSK